MLEHFVYAYREDIIRRSRQKVARRLEPPPSAGELREGVALCLDDLMDALRLRRLPSGGLSDDGRAHRPHRVRREFAPSQVVHEYGDVYQAITEVTTEKRVPISAEDFHLLIRCRDDALAAALADHRHEHDHALPRDV